MSARWALGETGRTMESFDLEIVHRDGRAIVCLSGVLDHTADTGELAARLGAAAATGPGGGPPRLVVDLTRVRFLDSSGVRMLLVVREALRPDGSLHVVTPRDGLVEHVLTVLGLTEALNLRATVGDALADGADDARRHADGR